MSDLTVTIGQDNELVVTIGEAAVVPPITVLDEGAEITGMLSSVDFRGSGVTAVAGDDGTVTVTITGSALSAAEIADEAFSNPPGDLTTSQKAAVREAIDVTDSALTDDEILDLAQPTRSAADRRKFLGTSAADEDDLTLLDDPADGLNDRINNLDDLTSDLHAGSPSAGWSDISAASQGGIREYGDEAPTLAIARGIVNANWRLALTEPQAQFRWGIMRIPASADARNYRIQATGLPEDGSLSWTQPVSQWTRLGLSSDGNWVFYRTFAVFGDVSVKVQVTGNAAHLGTSRYDGGLSTSKVLEALGLSSLSVLATDAEVTAAVEALKGGAPADFDTLKGLADAILERWDDQDDWLGNLEYRKYQVVRNDGASYVALRDVPANQAALTEPGSGTSWATYWYRIGWAEGAPSSHVGTPTIDGHKLKIEDRSGAEHEVTLPSASETAPVGLSYFQQWNENTSDVFDLPAFNTLTDAQKLIEEDTRADKSQGSATPETLTLTALTTTAPGGLDLGGPIFVDYSGELRISVAAGSVPQLVQIGTTINPAPSSNIGSTVGDYVDTGLAWADLPSLFMVSIHVLQTGRGFRSEQAVVRLSEITDSPDSSTGDAKEKTRGFALPMGGLAGAILQLSRGKAARTDGATDPAKLYYRINSVQANGANSISFWVINSLVSEPEDVHNVEIRVGYQFFAGETNQTTLWRSFFEELIGTGLHSIPLRAFGTILRIPPGTYTNDSGDQYTLAQSAFDAPVKGKLLVALRGFEGGSDTVRSDMTLTSLDLVSQEFVVYQLGTLSSAPPSLHPHVSAFGLTGNIDPVAGSIGTLVYGYSYEVSQSSHVSAARIVGFKGTAANPTSVAVLKTIAAADYHGGSGSVTIPGGVSLAADETYTVRLEVYESPLDPATDLPTSYKDARITAVAAASKRYAGWSAAAVPTQTELDAAAEFTGNALTIPRSATNGYLFFAVDQSLGEPSEALFDGNAHDILGGFTQRANGSVDSTTVLIWSSNSAQSAAILGTGSRVLTLIF